jgi:hypothetical protein
MLYPREIVDIMRAKHGVATSDDVSKLRDPLSRALTTSLSDLTDHMDSFLLASQRLTRSGQRETDYKYFKLFLETVSGFPSVPASMAGYYTTYPAILQQSLANHAFPVPRKLEGSPHSRCPLLTVFGCGQSCPEVGSAQPPASAPPQQQSYQAAAAC